MPDTSAKTVYSGQLPQDAPAIAVIMAGGSGTRFWPLSRRDKPKQFLPLGAGEGIADPWQPQAGLRVFAVPGV